MRRSCGKTAVEKENSGKTKNRSWRRKAASTALVAAATAAAAGAAASGAWREGFGGTAGDGRAKDGKLDRGFLAGALGAGDFLLFVEDDFFEGSFAIVADVFVDGHEIGLDSGCTQVYRFLG